MRPSYNWLYWCYNSFYTYHSLSGTCWLNSQCKHQDNVTCFWFPVFLTGSSPGQYQYDPKAFLYSLVNKPGWAPVKLPQTGQYSSRRTYSIYSYSSYGPIFGGGHDIYVSNQASSNDDSQANLGHTYSPPSGHSYSSTFAQTFLAGGSNYNFTPDEVETFYETT